jgi:hypothetical protein
MAKASIPTDNLTADQRAIVDRVTSEDTSWFAIGEESMVDFSLSVNPMDLKANFPEAHKLQTEKKYVFRFCERTPTRIDELTRSAQPPLRWAIVNRQSLPELTERVDPILGCVCCLDQMLLFKPYSHHIKVMEARNRSKEAKTKSVDRRFDQYDKMEFKSGPKSAIGNGDVVTYEDKRDDSNEFLVD